MPYHREILIAPMILNRMAHYKLLAKKFPVSRHTDCAVMVLRTLLSFMAGAKSKGTSTAGTFSPVRRHTLQKRVPYLQAEAPRSGTELSRSEIFKKLIFKPATNRDSSFATSKLTQITR